jgi:hypothetical protein
VPGTIQRTSGSSRIRRDQVRRIFAGRLGPEEIRADDRGQRDQNRRRPYRFRVCPGATGNVSRPISGFGRYFSFRLFAFSKHGYLRSPIFCPHFHLGATPISVYQEGAASQIQLMAIRPAWRHDFKPAGLARLCASHACPGTARILLILRVNHSAE